MASIEHRPGLMTRRAEKFTFGDTPPSRSGGRGWIVVLLLVGMGALGAYWYFNPGAQPAILADLLPSDPSAETVLYRWQDEQGQWVVTDRPPAEGITYEEVRYRDDANVIPATRPAEND